MKRGRPSATTAAWLGCIFVSLVRDPSVVALMAATGKSPAAKPAPSLQLHATTIRDAIYDGPEWTSIRDCLGIDDDGTTDYGRMTVAVGTAADSGDRIVGVVVADEAAGGATTVALRGGKWHVHGHSVAKVPANVKDPDAANTMIASLTGVHCTLPRVQGVGGADRNDDQNSMVSGKVVILGGSEYACFAAEGLSALGAQVSLVSTANVNLNNAKVDVLRPAVGDDEVGFAAHIGEFDALLDTADDERPSKRFFSDQEEDGDDDVGMASMGRTLRLLQQRHKCERYVSSLTKAQSIVNREGVFFGPGKVKDHVKEVQQHLDSKPGTFSTIVPPESFGKTVEFLLNKGIVYKNSKDFLTSSNNLVLRGWSLKDFIETSTWPSDSSGGGGSRMVRYGLPVLEDVDESEEVDGEFTMISASPESSQAEFIERKAWDEDIEKAAKKRQDEDLKNPFVKKIVGEQGMFDTIVKEKRDCVLFLSAPFCKTCKTLNPRFTTLARETMQNHGEDENGILFAKADASGEVGKDLSRLLKVASVPAFLLFRSGRRFGPTMSISRIPSKKLSAAIDLLESGKEWDTQYIQEAEEKRQ